jgi:predicted permease
MSVGEALQGCLRDMRYGLRQLRRMPGFSAVAILTLGLGIGANAAVFSVMNAIVLRYLPVANPQQLVILHYTNQPDRSSQTGYDDTSLPEKAFESLRDQKDVLADLMAFVPLGTPKVEVRFGSEPEEAAADEVSGNFFSGLGVPIFRGRGFTPQDESKHAQLAVLSYAYWSGRFGRNPSILNQPMYIKGVPFTVVGIAAPEFIGLERGRATDIWVPFQTDPRLKPWGRSPQDEQALYGSPSWFFLMTVGRLQPGVSPERAQAQLDPVFKQSVHQALGQPKRKDRDTGLNVTVARGIEGISETYRQQLWTLMAMVGLVLLIACANVALLLIARNARRERDFSIRLALGASARSVFRQLLMESVLLVLAGGALGWVFAKVGTGALAAWSNLDMSLDPDGRVLAFALLICAIAAFAFGLAPLRGALLARNSFRVNTSANASAQDRRKVLGGHAVVAVQISLCLTLLVGAGLLVRTLKNLENANLGLRARGLLVFGVRPPDAVRGDAASKHFFNTLVQRLRTLPEVESATLVQERPGSGWSNNTGVKVDGAVPGGKSFALLRWNSVGADFFHVMDVPILIGRDFNDADTATSPRVAIVNQTFVNKYLNGGIAVGRQMQKLGDPEDVQQTIVGVVADSKYTSVREEPTPIAYFPFTQVSNISTMHVELRTIGNPAALLPEVRRAVKEFGPDFALLQPMTQLEEFEKSFSTDRLFARLSVVFGVLAVVLVCTGLYGTLAYRVSRRTAEIGVRIALGAQRRQVLWLVARESLLVCSLGVLVGLPLAFACSRLLRSMLFNLTPFDPRSFLIALIGVAVVTLVATVVPARRASLVDPIVALRYE